MNVKWPEWKEEYIKEDSFTYPICINGKKELSLEINNLLSKEDIELFISEYSEIQTILNGKPIKKVIVVIGRIINIVV